MGGIRNCEIAGYGTYLPERTVQFDGATRYRIEDGVSQLDMLSAASRQAIDMAGIEPDELDCIMVGSAVGSQPIPCTAALLQEQIAPEAPAAALDVNSTCTSFITTLDIASRYIHDGQYKRILVTSGDVGTRFLNSEQPESYKLFSDAAASIVLSSTDDATKGVLASTQRTWPKHAHDTEIRGGLTAMPPELYTDQPDEYLFDMDGRAALLGMIRVLPDFFTDFYERSELTLDDFALVIPHQASPALKLVARVLDIPPSKFVDHVEDYGNMVSASVPYMLAKKLGEGVVGSGDTVLLCGTAAGLTANALALRL